MRILLPKVSLWVVLWIIFSVLSYLIFCFNPDALHLLAFNVESWLSSISHLRFLTFSLITDEFVILLLGSVSVFMLDKLVSTSWKPLQFLLFYFFVHAFALTVTVLLCRALTGGGVIYGSSAILASVLVLATQFDPDRFLVGWKTVGLTTRYGFTTILLLLSVFALARIIRLSDLLLFISGFFASWFYLRFLQYHPHRKYGDHRPGFALAKFFPEPLERWVAIPSNMFYRFLLRTKLCPGIERQSEIISTASFAVNIPGLTADSERHRKLARKVLNERLAAANNPTSAKSQQPEWPSLDDDIASAKQSSAIVQLPTQSPTPLVGTMPVGAKDSSPV